MIWDEKGLQQLLGIFFWLFWSSEMDARRASSASINRYNTMYTIDYCILYTISYIMFHDPMTCKSISDKIYSSIAYFIRPQQPLQDTSLLRSCRKHPESSRSRMIHMKPLDLILLHHWTMSNGSVYTYTVYIYICIYTYIYIYP